MMSPHSLAVLGPNIAAYNVVDSMADNLPTVHFPRTPGRPAMRTRTSPQ
jgi:hypothetical protein